MSVLATFAHVIVFLPGYVCEKACNCHVREFWGVLFETITAQTKAHVGHFFIIILCEMIITSLS